MSEVGSNGGNSQPVSPLGKLNLASKLKLQSKLSLEGSIVQFNMHEEKNKKNYEKNEKLRLQQQIGHLRKVIRQMQMQKIKSIEPEQLKQLGLRPQDFHKKNNFVNSLNNSKIDKWKDSLQSDMVQTKKNPWNLQIRNKIQDDTGKIIKNSPGKIAMQVNPRKLNKINAEKGIHWSETEDRENEDDFEHFPLPLKKKNQSLPMKNKRKGDLSKDQLINKFDENQRNFQQFLETSRINNQSESQIGVETPQQKIQNISQFTTKPIKILSNIGQESIGNTSIKKNYSQIFEKIKNQNLQNQNISVPQIKITNIEFPQLPQPPNLSMTQQQLLQLARKTYRIFGIDIQANENQLCMKKYKNCVVFTLGYSIQTILWHYSGKFYMGGWKNNDSGQGQKTDEGIQYTPGKHIYKGQFLNGKKNGIGIMKMNNSNIYEGQWVDGVKNGRGVYFQANSGTIYSGQWKDGKRDGFGLLKFSQTQFYQGIFLRSVKHGYGIQKFANGDVYKGEYQRGKFHGKGKYIWMNGSSYQGTFLQGLRHGQGNWKSSREGGDIYIGAYGEDKKNGYGRYVWSNGCIYEGYFKNDYKHGKGRLTYQDGKQIKGIWQQGNLIGTQGDRKIQDHQQSPLKKSIHLSSIKNSAQNFPHSNKFSYI